jgi:hypothetical protein
MIHALGKSNRVIVDAAHPYVQKQTPWFTALL